MGSKTTAKDHPIGTRFRWDLPGGYWYELINHNSNIPGCCEMRLDGRHDAWIDYNDAIFSSDRVEIVYPKSDNFNTLYEKLNSTNL